MQGSRGERRNIGQCILDKGLGGPLAFAHSAFLNTVADGSLLIAYPEAEGTEEHIALGQLVERVHNLAVKKLEVGRRAHVNAGELADAACRLIERGAIGER